MIAPIRSPVMVGRDDELARLEDALLSARHGDGSIVVLCGDAGVGKSRLASELMRRAGNQGCTVLAGECSEADLTVPYLPFIEAIGNRLDGATIARIRAALGPEAALLAGLFPQLGSPGPSADAGDAPMAKLRLFEAIVALMHALSAESGMLVVIEDLHWADGSTRELLTYLTRRLRGTRILILATHRSLEVDRHHPLVPTVQEWRRAGLSETVELDPLSAEQVGALVAAIFDADTVTPAFFHLLHERTDGNPFAVEELLRDAVDHGHITGTEESGWDRTALKTMGPPRSVADGILLRVERLDPHHADVLRAASVLGRGFDFRTLLRLAGQPEPVLLDALDACVGGQLLEEDPQRENGYRFRHALTREAVYNELIVSRRRLLHGRAAEVIRELRPDALAEVAHHLVAAGRWDDAAPACVAAAEDALRRLAPHEACELFELALGHVRGDRERGHLLCRLGEAWHLVGDVATAQRHLDDGVALLERAGDSMSAAHHRLNLGRCWWERARPDLAREHYEKARRVLEVAGPSEDLATVYMRLSGLESFELQGPEAQRLAERAVAIAEAVGADAARIAAIDWLGLSLCDQGRLDEGLGHLTASAEEAAARELVGLAARIVIHALSVLESYGRVAECPPLLERMRSFPRDPWIETAVPYYEGWVRYWSADLHGALASAAACVALAERFGIDAQAAWGRALLCLIQTELDRLDVAEPLVPVPGPDAERQEVLEQHWVALRYHMAHSDVTAAAAVAAEMSEAVWALAGTAVSDAAVEALLADGRAAQAEQLVVALAAQPRATMHAGHLQRAQGRVLLASGGWPSALALLEAASRTFARHGYRLEQLRTDLLVAQAHAAGGDPAAAATHIEAVLAAARDCGAKLMVRQAIDLAERIGVSVDLGSFAGGEHPEPEAVAVAIPDDVVLRTGERMVSVLFADVRGYTEMTRSLPPAEMHDRLSALQRWARMAVERHHGIVDKFVGDAIMATFNVSGAHIDHTEHAVEAALRLIDHASEAQLPLGAGIAVGPAIVGRLTDGANVTVMGTTTNLAARLQAQAGAGELLLSTEAHERVRDSPLLADRQVEECRLVLKGFDGPVRAHRVRRRRHDHDHGADHADRGSGVPEGKGVPDGRMEAQVPTNGVDFGVVGCTDAVEIGRGGFGVVYRARQAEFRRTVAVKLLGASMLDDAARLRFEREISAMGSLSGHPNIVTVHQAGFMPNGTAYIVMAFEAKGSMADRISATGPVPWEEALTMGVKLAGALEAAHRTGVLHRDVKPENILLSAYAEPKLADFGIARVEGTARTRSGVISASLGHAAPEVLSGDQPGVAADVYSLASTLFALILGRDPFADDSDESFIPMLQRIATAPPPDLRPHGVPHAVCNVLERAVAKDPALRPASAGAFGRELQEAQRACGLAVTPLPVEAS